MKTRDGLFQEILFNKVVILLELKQQKMLIQLIRQAGAKCQSNKKEE